MMLRSIALLWLAGLAACVREDGTRSPLSERLERQNIAHASEEVAKQHEDFDAEFAQAYRTINVPALHHEIHSREWDHGPRSDPTWPPAQQREAKTAFEQVIPRSLRSVVAAHVAARTARPGAAAQLSRMVKFWWREAAADREVLERLVKADHPHGHCNGFSSPAELYKFAYPLVKQFILTQHHVTPSHEVLDADKYAREFRSNNYFYREWIATMFLREYRRRHGQNPTGSDPTTLHIPAYAPGQCHLRDAEAYEVADLTFRTWNTDRLPLTKANNPFSYDTLVPLPPGYAYDAVDPPIRAAFETHGFALSNLFPSADQLGLYGRHSLRYSFM